MDTKQYIKEECYDCGSHFTQTEGDFMVCNWCGGIYNEVDY